MSEMARPQVELKCKPDKQEHELIFLYEFTNHGPGAVLVSDAYHGYDSTTRKAYADHDTLVIARQPNAYVMVLRGVPPPPTVTVTRPVSPLVRRVEAGDRIEGRMHVPLPLAEANPYQPYSNVRDYVQTAIEGVLIGLDWISPNTPGLETSHAEGTDGLLTLYAPSLQTIMTRATCSFPTRGLSLLVRKN